MAGDPGLRQKQKESIIRAELKRCMSTERRWNRNEVSRESPDKEVNRRPTLLKKFRADVLGGKGHNCDRLEYKIRTKEEYLVSFLFEAVSAALPAEWDVECRYESARVLTTVTFQFPRQGFVALPW